MKLTKPFTIDSEVYSSFEKAVPSGGRSQVIEELLKDYLNKFFPSSKDVKVLRELEKQKAQARLEELLLLEKDERDRDSEVVRKREREFAFFQAQDQRRHFEDDCRKRARIIVLADFGLDPLTQLLPESFSEEQKNSSKERWKVLTEKFLNQSHTD